MERTSLLYSNLPQKSQYDKNYDSNDDDEDDGGASCLLTRKEDWGHEEYEPLFQGLLTYRENDITLSSLSPHWK